MRKVTAIQLNAAYSAFNADRIAEADQFWSVLRAYISWCSFSVPAWLRDDLIQDVMLEIMTHLDRFKQGSNFAKWCNALLHNMRADRFRTHKYENPEVPFSQLAVEQDDGEFQEFEPSTMTEPSDDADLVLGEERESAAVVTLDSIRASLKKPADLALFDLLRFGKSMHEAADILGQPYRTIQTRFHSWQKKVDVKTNPCLQFPDVTFRSWYNPLPLLSGRPAA